MNIRNFFYRMASLLGDYNAVVKGRIVERVVRKETTKVALRAVASLFKR